MLKVPNDMMLETNNLMATQYLDMVEVAGSSPVSPTKDYSYFSLCVFADNLQIIHGCSLVSEANTNPYKSIRLSSYGDISPLGQLRSAGNELKVNLGGLV